MSTQWYKLTADETVQQLETDVEKGLTDAEARRRLEQYGPNELVEGKTKESWRIFLDQFKEVMVIVLMVAALVSGLLGEWLEVVVILAIVLLNAILGYTQERKAEEAMAALKKMSVPTVRVRRNGHIREVLSTQLVPGDILLVEAGNIVPADARVIESVNLKVEEATLTGESEPVEKVVTVPSGDNPPLGDRTDMLFMGTVISYGRGTAAVTATGMNTELGKIADLIQGVEEEMTPLQRRLADLGKTLAWAALGIVAVVVVLGILRGEDLETLFLTAVSLAVAAIPESLPAVVTITLALGSQRLLKRQALIRNLPSVETLGSVTVICSDKTGTLTENLMTVTILDTAGNTKTIETMVEQREDLLQAHLISPESSPELTALSVLVRAGALCNDALLESDDSGGVVAIGDPTEAALVLAAHQLGFEKAELEKEWPRVGEVPFSSERKRMTTVHQMSPLVKQSDVPWRDSPSVLMTKGGVDTMLPISTKVLVDNEIVPMDNEMRERILSSNARLAQQGQRVLGVAFRFCDREEPPTDPTELENDMVFVGLVAMMDPPRPEVREAVAVAREAGIRPVMITGDHPLTALQIARDLNITDNGDVLTGQELDHMSVEDLQKVVDDVSVYARVAPEHKLNIVQALQQNGEIAAMTGDGVNDAPALKRADIGVAMGITGTDVSKQASDIVLLDDNFATIVAAVEEGRVIYDNIRKFIKYTLSSNIGELFVMLVGPFLGMALPLLPLQILWINLVTDGLPGLALAQEKGERGVMQRPPFEPQESVFSRGIGTQIIWIGTMIGLISLGIGYAFWRQDASGPWQTMIFTTLVFAQLGNALAIRSNVDSLFTIGAFSNRLMVIAVAAGILLQLALIYVPLLQRIFGTQALSIANLFVCMLGGVAVLAVIELTKWLGRRRGRE
ncbi:MAG: cation-translocating P-type ATPase [Chloroflexota bacterium]|nr:cation-translocating P-type ATPase [Chloroflexota bacterium]